MGGRSFFYRCQNQVGIREIYHLWWSNVFYRLSTLPLQHKLCISGNYSCLVAHFYLKRSVSYHLIQSYLPSILIVAISWVSFWMDIEAVPGRISLGVITLLAVSSQAGRPGQGELNWKYPLCKIQNMYYVSNPKVQDISSN